ncbi:hypothetical protein [uncultured Parabacteroides sp.]|uniref:hypothetical protein n=1 Tax=uncultured Parabacteroides sp. TaxID=512312 RepID=UPI00259B096B|nr:hypothetical protein [uncultured Parabacteroides sp.]
MKKSVLSMLAVAALVFGMTSCNGAKKSNEQAQETEEAAVIAGQAPKDLLTEELKQETINLLKDMPDSEIPYRLTSGDVKVNVGDVKYMLPIAKAAELSTPTQKARALGMYMADYNVLKGMGQPTAEVEAVIAKLATDLNISFVLDILKEQAPKDATKEQVQAFLQSQEDKIIEKMAAEDKIDVEVEMLGAASAEYACLIANPTLVVKGDATSAGLSANMEKRVSMLEEVVADLANYYPDLKQLGETISPLKTKVATIQDARAANADITAIRDSLLK